MSVVNFGRRDQMLIKSVIGVRYETSPEQLRYLLVKIREMLLGHPRIHPDSVRARFIGFGACSLDIEVFAYVKTTDPGGIPRHPGRRIAAGHGHRRRRAGPVSPFRRRPSISVAMTDWMPAGPRLPKPRCANGATRAACRSRTSRQSKCDRCAGPWPIRRRVPRKRQPPNRARQPLRLKNQSPLRRCVMSRKNERQPTIGLLTGRPQ